MILTYLKHLGPLRGALSLAALVLIVFRPEVGAEVAHHGTAVVTTLLFPVLAPLIFLLLMLDALMTKVMIGPHQELREKFRHVMWTDLLLGLAMLLYWLPYFISLNQL